MSTFSTTINPTPFGAFDSEADFQTEADKMVVFVKRKLGDDILSVELTKKQIWACFEEASLEYSKQINEMQIKSEMTNLLGMPTGSNMTNKYPLRTLEYMQRQAEPYASLAGVGGSYDSILGYINLQDGVQDYDIYNELVDAVSGSNVFNSLANKSKLRIMEVFHFEPLAAQQFLLNASNITNFLATNFNYESYVNSTVFYVLPIFEDTLRRGMLESAFRLRRSHFSYQITGRRLRLFPVPSVSMNGYKLFISVATAQDPLNPAYQNDSIDGVSGPQNAPYGVIPYNSVTSVGRQWIRDYTFALARELLGLVRSKFDSIPIPNADLKLNGSELIAQGREDKDKLITQLREYLANFTHDKLMELDANRSEQLVKQLKYAPMPLGKAIIIG